MHLWGSDALSGSDRPRLPAIALPDFPCVCACGDCPRQRGRLCVGDSHDSSDCDDSDVPPAAAPARLPPCLRGQSPASHWVTRMPINSLGFSLKVPCTFGALLGSDRPRLPAITSPDFPCVRACGDCPRQRGRPCVADSHDSSDCDDSDVPPAAAPARLPPCLRGQSPASHWGDHDIQ